MTVINHSIHTKLESTFLIQVINSYFGVFKKKNHFYKLFLVCGDLFVLQHSCGTFSNLCAQGIMKLLNTDTVMQLSRLVKTQLVPFESFSRSNNNCGGGGGSIESQSKIFVSSMLKSNMVVLVPAQETMFLNINYTTQTSHNTKKMKVCR